MADSLAGGPCKHQPERREGGDRGVGRGRDGLGGGERERWFEGWGEGEMVWGVGRGRDGLKCFSQQHALDKAKFRLHSCSFVQVKQCHIRFTSWSVMPL